ncbi:hypothetical protein NMG60_11003429 [Bertholletia excelsa]
MATTRIMSHGEASLQHLIRSHLQPTAAAATHLIKDAPAPLLPLPELRQLVRHHARQESAVSGMSINPARFIFGSVCPRSRSPVVLGLRFMAAGHIWRTMEIMVIRIGSTTIFPMTIFLSMRMTTTTMTTMTTTSETRKASTVTTRKASTVVRGSESVSNSPLIQ